MNHGHLPLFSFPGDGLQLENEKDLLAQEVKLDSEGPGGVGMLSLEQGPRNRVSAGLPGP